MKVNQEQLINLYQNGTPITVLIKKFGISKSHLYQILKNNNTTTHQSSMKKKSREDQIIKDYEKYMPISDICHKYQINDPASIYYILKKRKIKLRKEKKQDVDLEYILKLYNEGKSPLEIGELINKSRSFVRRILIKNNVKLRQKKYYPKKNKVSKKDNNKKPKKLYNNKKNIINNNIYRHKKKLRKHEKIHIHTGKSGKHFQNSL